MDKDLRSGLRVVLIIALLALAYYGVERKLDADRLEDAKELLYGH